MTEDLNAHEAVDWSKAIEAVSATGSVHRAMLCSSGGYGYRVGIEGWPGMADVHKSGAVVNSAWRIRNVAEAKHTDSGTVDVQARMEALCWRIADNSSSSVVVDLQDEAREIVALLPEPVDPDLQRARQIADDVAEDATAFDRHDLEQAAYAGILWGRTLTGGLGRALEKGQG